jgi:hypothetical protein
MRLGWCIEKNGSQRWIGVEGGDEMKNKIKKYRLTVGNLTKRAKAVKKIVSNV